MSSALTGFLILFGVSHLILIMIPIISTLKASISRRSKALWCLFLLLLPVIGIAVFHFRYKTSLIQGKGYERSVAEERASSGTFAPHDND